jgi:hypothetical protein
MCKLVQLERSVYKVDFCAGTQRYGVPALLLTVKNEINVVNRKFGKIIFIVFSTNDIITICNKNIIFFFHFLKKDKRIFNCTAVKLLVVELLILQKTTICIHTAVISCSPNTVFKNAFPTSKYAVHE